MSWAGVVVAAVAVMAYLYLQSRPPVPQAQGSCTERFKGVEDAYRANFVSGLESGSAFAAYHKGKLVCDLWGGWADPTTGLPWQERTMPVVFSATKAVCAFTLALLCDRGLCDFDELVTKYWPEFGQNGKENVTLRMLLSHQAGLVAIDKEITMDMIVNDNDEVSRILAAQRPNWPPGTDHGYHALSFGPYVDQLVRRIDPTHRSLQQVFREEIAVPFDIDFYIGVPLSEQWRVARYNVQPPLSFTWDMLTQSHMRNLMYKMMVGDQFVTKAITNPAMAADEAHLNWPQRRVLPQGSFNGYGTARALARLYSLVVAAVHHEAVEDTPPLLSKRVVDQFHKAVTLGPERVFGIPMRIGLGVMILPTLNNEGRVTIGHPGKGCQIGMAVQDLNLSMAYITNFPSAIIDTLEDPRVAPLYEEVIGAAANL